MEERFELSFDAGLHGLDVRRFTIREALSSRFEVSVFARSPEPDIPLEPFLNKKASFTIRSGVVHVRHQERAWGGVVSHMEQLRVEKPTAGSRPLSTYYLRIVPRLWLLGHRRNHLVHQRKTVVQIVQDVLGEWGIAPALKLAKTYRVLDYVVQYGETDLAFVSRLLEWAGITYWFDFGGGKDGLLTLDDHPEDAAERPGIPCVDNPSRASEREYVSQVRIGHRVRPGRFTTRDFDFRRKADYPLFGNSPRAPAPEDFYEQYHYLPGSTLAIDPKDGDGSTPVADDKGKVRSVEDKGKTLAERGLVSVRRDKRFLAFHTNCVDLAPGVAFTALGHPRDDVGHKVLITEFSLDGTPGGEWTHEGEAAFAATPWAPEIKTPRPRVHGVETAVVVGPPGQEIYTDEFGRVRVQFAWDRKGKKDDNSSCWMRVSHGWAGTGYGSINIPRVGQEVLVSFLDGDPDQPVIVGRVYNAVRPIPKEVTQPKHQTRSTWMSDTSDHTDNSYNEIRFEDEKTREYIYLQAQKDLQKLVKRDETERTGENRAELVGKNRSAIVAAIDATLVGVKHSVQIMEPPSPASLKILEMQKPEVTPLPTKLELVDGKILCTSGKATAAFEGGDISFEARGQITFKAGGSIIVEGGSDIKINS
jgi:type VI secretion system secreted protein VgrG